MSEQVTVTMSAWAHEVVTEAMRQWAATPNDDERWEAGAQEAIISLRNAVPAGEGWVPIPDDSPDEGDDRSVTSEGTWRKGLMTPELLEQEREQFRAWATQDDDFDMGARYE